MINLEKVFKNHFASEKISDNALQKFSEDHLARLSSYSAPGTFVPILGQTTDAHIAYFGSISDERVVTAIRQGMTLRVDDQIAAFKKLVQQKEGAIRSAFGEHSAGYLEFFPAGITEYTRATKENIELVMDNLAKAAMNNAGSLEAGLADIFINARDTYKTLRDAQLGKKGTVSDHKVRSAAARNVLELQLTGNIHYIGWQFRGDVAKCMQFFDQSFLRDKSTGAHGEDDEQPAGSVAG